MNFSWHPLDFDSEIFDFAMAKIDSVSARSFEEADAVIKQVIEDLRKNKIKYATHRLPAGEFPLIHALEKNGFVLVDGLIALETKLEANSIPVLEENIQEATEQDIPQLKLLASHTFSLNRFYTDPFIPKEKADLLFEKWIENSVFGKAADKVLVWKEDGKIAAFITLKKSGHVPLIGVSQDLRGRGIAKKLIQGAFTVFSSWEVSMVNIETQMTNISALRAYGSCGFKITNSFLTFSWHD